MLQGAVQLGARLLAPLAELYYKTDMEVARSSEHSSGDNNFTVTYSGKEVAHVGEIGEKLACDCGQDKDIGTSCPHILCTWIHR